MPLGGVFRTLAATVNRKMELIEKRARRSVPGWHLRTLDFLSFAFGFTLAQSAGRTIVSFLPPPKGRRAGWQRE